MVNQPRVFGALGANFEGGGRTFALGDEKRGLPTVGDPLKRRKGKRGGDRKVLVNEGGGGLFWQER